MIKRLLIAFALWGVAGGASAVSSDQEAFLEAVEECRKMVLEGDKGYFPARNGEIRNGFAHYGRLLPGEELDVTYILSLAESIDNSAPPFWQCEMRPDLGIWDLTEVRAAMDNFSGKRIIPNIKAAFHTEKYHRLKYVDCTDPAMPVSFYFQVERAENGFADQTKRPEHWYVSIEEPAFETDFCFKEHRQE
jgi:hypothetical protein